MKAGNGRQAQCIFCAFRSEAWRPSFSDITSSDPLRIRSYHLFSRGRNKLRNVPHLRDKLGPSARQSLDSIRSKGPFKIPSTTHGRLRSVPPKVHLPYKDSIRGVILKRTQYLKDELENSPLLSTQGFKESLESFSTWQLAIRTSLKATASSDSEAKDLFESLKKAYIDGGLPRLDLSLKNSFYGRILRASFSTADNSKYSRLADLRYPAEWFPSTRQLQRTVHLHVGPTNSGKTYHALKKLEQADSGIYAGPLRLLAHEVYTRLNAKGKLCNLVTGDERKISLDAAARMSSCTVEMVPINVAVDVAVIDEIQMIGSPDRGWAWTEALLGVKAKELHVCGETRVVPLIKQLIASTGDLLEIHQYERLSPLKTMQSSLRGDLKKLRKGDCVVLFSRVGIHSLKKEIENVTGKRVAVVYGSLPPEIRAKQAQLFNDPNNDYDILVASDAIGMGLNLSIKRIIFETSQKHNGREYGTLEIPEIKQIAGRAGRYRTAAEADTKVNFNHNKSQSIDSLEDVIAPLPPAKNLGLVTTLEDADLPLIQYAMNSEAPPLKTAGLFPPAMILERFASYFPPQTPFSFVLSRLHELSRLHPRYHLCELKDQIQIADLLQTVPLSIADRIIFIAAPCSIRDPGMPQIAKAFAQCVADGAGGGLLDIKELEFDILDDDRTPDRERLRQLEIMHKSLVLYIWLSYRFIGVFTSRPLATHVKELLEEKIQQGLANAALDSSLRQKKKELRERSLIRNLMKGGFGVKQNDGEWVLSPPSWDPKSNNDMASMKERDQAEPKVVVYS